MRLCFTLGVSNVDVDVIKLTAQYTAVSGRHFLAGLAQREQRNPQFDFLKPTHLLFSYFTGLVDAYTKVGKIAMWAVHACACMKSLSFALLYVLEKAI